MKKIILSLWALLALFSLAADSWASQSSEVYEWPLAADEEVCEVVDYDDASWIGVTPEGNPIGLGTHWTDYAQAEPSPRRLRRWSIELPPLNPEGAGAYAEAAPGDPTTLIFRFTGRSFRWVQWENTSPIPHSKPIRLMTEFRPWFEYHPNPWFPNSTSVLFSAQDFFAWHHWTPAAPLGAFDGTVDGEGASGWHFACGPTLDFTSNGEWCLPGNGDYHSFEWTRVVEWSDLSNVEREAFRAGLRVDYLPLVRQFVNYDVASPTPGTGEEVSLSNGHGWRIEWGLRHDMGVRLIVLR